MNKLQNVFEEFLTNLEREGVSDYRILECDEGQKAVQISLADEGDGGIVAGIALFQCYKKGSDELVVMDARWQGFVEFDNDDIDSILVYVDASNSKYDWIKVFVDRSLPMTALSARMQAPVHEGEVCEFACSQFVQSSMLIVGIGSALKKLDIATAGLWPVAQCGMAEPSLEE